MNAVELCETRPEWFADKEVAAWWLAQYGQGLRDAGRLAQLNFIDEILEQKEAEEC